MPQPVAKGGAPGGAASLPMYDWPEILSRTDELWLALRTQLRRRGMQAPDHLARPDDPEPMWLDPALVLSQTCGYPYANRLTGKVTLIGALEYPEIGAKPGHYFSVLVARRNDLPGGLADLRDRRFAFNVVHSQSGFAAPLRLLAGTGCHSQPEPLATGAHRASIQAVAQRRADWAAIDAVTWELAKRHEPAAQQLEVFAATPETPGLPLIASARFREQADRIADAVNVAIGELPPATCGAVMLSGLTRFKPADYAALAEPLPIAATLPSLAIGEA